MNQIDSKENMKNDCYYFLVGNEKLARLLIHNGADFTARNSQGKSASNIARDKGNPKKKIYFFLF